VSDDGAAATAYFPAGQITVVHVVAVVVVEYDPAGQFVQVLSTTYCPVVQSAFVGVHINAKSRNIKMDDL
jgi:hypothetical protein